MAVDDVIGDGLRSDQNDQWVFRRSVRIRLARCRTKVSKIEADKRGIDLKISDAQQKQENRSAVRSFIAQGVDAIFLAPVVSTGWDTVLKEAKDAKIPVVLLDRSIETKDPSLYLTAVTSDTVYEGKVAAEWLAKETGGKCNVVELQGTVGSSPAINRKKGFDQVVAADPGMKIVRTQSGDFTRTKGKEVMESFIKAEGGGKNICAVYAHNDDMAIGAIQAIKEAGLKPGKDIKIVSIDGVPDIFKAIVGRRSQCDGRVDAKYGGSRTRCAHCVQEGRQAATQVDPDRVQGLHPGDGEGRIRKAQGSLLRSFKGSRHRLPAAASR